MKQIYVYIHDKKKYFIIPWKKDQWFITDRLTSYHFNEHNKKESTFEIFSKDNSIKFSALCFKLCDAWEVFWVEYSEVSYPQKTSTEPVQMIFADYFDEGDYIVSSADAVSSIAKSYGTQMMIDAQFSRLDQNLKAIGMKGLVRHDGSVFDTNESQGELINITRMM